MLLLVSLVLKLNDCFLWLIEKLVRVVGLGVAGLGVVGLGAVGLRLADGFWVFAGLLRLLLAFHEDRLCVLAECDFLEVAFAEHKVLQVLINDQVVGSFLADRTLPLLHAVLSRRHRDPDEIVEVEWLVVRGAMPGTGGVGDRSAEVLAPELHLELGHLAVGLAVLR